MALNHNEIVRIERQVGKVKSLMEYQHRNTMAHALRLAAAQYRTDAAGCVLTTPSIAVQFERQADECELIAECLE